MSATATGIFTEPGFRKKLTRRNENQNLVKMKRKYLPLIALVVGFIWALITVGVHSMLFVLLPLLAFTFGYFSSWRWGLLNGFLLFLGYTMATAVMWRDVLNAINILTYFYTFTSGGFSLLLIGALAPVVRRGIRKFWSIAALISFIPQKTLMVLSFTCRQGSSQGIFMKSCTILPLKTPWLRLLRNTLKNW